MTSSTTRIAPHIAPWYGGEVHVRELPREVGILGLLGVLLQVLGTRVRGCERPGAYRLARLELEAVDSRDRSLASVQKSLAR